MVRGEHEGPHHSFVVIAPMITEFGREIKHYVFYTKVIKICDVTLRIVIMAS